MNRLWQKCITVLALVIISQNEYAYSGIQIIPLSAAVVIRTEELGIQLNQFSQVDIFDNDIFILDYMGHRILRIDAKGNILKAFGGIGQAHTDLFEPNRFFIEKTNKLLYVSNLSGQEIKIFDMAGRYRNHIYLGKGNHLSSLAVDPGGLIYTDARSKASFGRRADGLISVYDQKGKRVKKMGRMVLAENYPAFEIFNRVGFVYHGGYIIGAHQSLPILFKYRIDGREEYNNPLELKDIPGLENILDVSDEAEINAQLKRKESKGIKAKQFIRGLQPLNELKYLYNIGGKMLLFNGDGTFADQRLEIAIDNKPVQVISFAIDNEVAMVGLGFWKNDHNRLPVIFRTGQNPNIKAVLHEKDEMGVSAVGVDCTPHAVHDRRGVVR